MLVGGLTDGLFAVPYWLPLAAALADRGVALVQPLLSSSHAGWGTASLDGDAAELGLLGRHMREQRGGSAGFVLIGHSTGCQDTVRYAERHGADGLLRGAVLQAPVSDREWLARDGATAARLAEAHRLVAAGTPDAIVTRFDAWDGAPVTARRFVALAAVRGDDDMFSSDLGNAEVRSLLRPLAGVPTLVLTSSKEQYGPPGYDATAAAARLATAVGPSARAATLDGDHALAGAEQEAAELIAGFVVECFGEGPS